MTGNDPRVYFAAERTLLAWVRTSLGLIGLGFVVAKFGLFLRLMRPDVDHPPNPWFPIIGVLLAAVGAVASSVAAWQHRRFCRTLEANELPPNYRVEPTLWFGFGVAIAGVALAAIIVL